MITLFGLDPLTMWAGFLVLVVIMLWIDLGAFNKEDHVIGIKESLLWTAFWIFLSLVFNALLWWQLGTEIALEYLTGYIIEKSLSMDNLFVFLMIFTAFQIPRKYQHRTLFWGIVGAVVMRGLFIGIGAALVSRFQWIFLFFGAIILYAAYRMEFQEEKKFDPEESWIVAGIRRVFPVTDKMHGHDFFMKVKGRWHATILFVALITIEMTDVIFATDSIPAIFGVTQDPFIVFTSNIFAILGLRALYFAIAGLHAMFAYLKTGLAIILAFIGVKMIALVILHVHIPVSWSLAFIMVVLTVSILASVYHGKKGKHSHKLITFEDGRVHIKVHRRHVKELHKKE